MWNLLPVQCKLDGRERQRCQRNWTVPFTLIIQLSCTQRPQPQSFSSASKSLVGKESWEAWRVEEGPAGHAVESLKERLVNCGWSEGQAQFTDSEEATQTVATRRACGPSPGENLQPCGTKGGAIPSGVDQEGESMRCLRATKVPVKASNLPPTPPRGYRGSRGESLPTKARVTAALFSESARWDPWNLSRAHCTSRESQGSLCKRKRTC